jgi:uncharacterized damage-inducible protein DinB
MVSVRTSEARDLFDYLYWTRDAIARAASELPGEEFRAPETVTNRDLRATLVHELDVEWSWRERLRGANWDDWGPDAELNADEFPSLDAVMEHWRRDEAQMRSWLDGLTDADLDAPAPNEDDPAPLWFYVMHLVSHGIQQFSEAAVLLTRAGHSPGDIGFLEWAAARRR